MVFDQIVQLLEDLAGVSGTKTILYEIQYCCDQSFAR